MAADKHTCTWVVVTWRERRRKKEQVRKGDNEGKKRRRNQAKKTKQNREKKTRRSPTSP